MVKLSVIVLCHNFEGYIETCLLSILNQKTDFDFEILVCDDASTDNSVSCIELISKSTSQIKFFKNEVNLGGQLSFKKLFEQTLGEYVAYIDGDDYWIDQTKLQKQVDFLDKNKDYQMCFTGYYEKNNQNIFKPTNNLSYWFTNGGTPENDDFRELLIYHNVVHFGKVFRNNKNLMKNYFLDLLILDWPLNFEISLLGKIKYLNFPSGVHRIHSNNMMTFILNDDKLKLEKSEKTTEEVVIEILRKRYEEDKHILDNLL